MIPGEVDDFPKTLQAEFERHADATVAAQQRAYLKDQFSFYGLKTPLRRSVQQPFLIAAHLPPKENLEGLVRTLWNRPQRECHYFAQELCLQYKKRFERNDIRLFEHMILHNSWWDTVDFIAPKLIKAYFHTFPDQRDPYINTWLSSGNIWLQRSCLIFQLLEREKTDVQLLRRSITALLGSQEFFINKAIGWALRDYSRTDPDWVTNFVHSHDLHPLSEREALRRIK